MEKQEVLDRLEEIADSMNSDFLNRQEIEAIVDDIKDLQWQLNANTKDFKMADFIITMTIVCILLLMIEKLVGKILDKIK